MSPFRRPTIACGVLLAASCLLTPSACTRQNDSTKPVKVTGMSLTPVNAAEVRDLYVRHCAACHGLEGHGDGQAAEQLYPKPRSFHESPFRFAATGGNDTEVLAAIGRTIRGGLPRSAMPGFGGVLEQSRIEALAQYVLGLSKAQKFDEPPAPAVEKIGPQPELTNSMLARGEGLFRANCVSCHGEAGHGDGPTTLGMVDSLHRPVRPADLASGLYKSGRTPQDLYRTIVSGVPGTPMPPHRDLLIKKQGDGMVNDYDVWALVAYVQSLAGGPKFDGIASGAELAAQPAEDPEMLPDPSNAAWLKVERKTVAMRSLWQRREGTVSLNLCVLRTCDRIAIRLDWEDPTINVDQDSRRFPDAAAVMFAMTDEIPALPMGVQVEGHMPKAPVNIWQWKASRQYDASSGVRHDSDEPRLLEPDNYHLFGLGPAHPPTEPVAAPPGVDEDLRAGERLYRTAAEVGNVHSDPTLTPHAVLEANAEGFGTLAYQPASDQSVYSTAAWGNGHWFVTIIRDLNSGQKLDIQFAGQGPEHRIPVAFAVWDGAKGDRDGMKLISGWHWIIVKE